MIRRTILTLWGISAVRYLIVGGLCFLADVGILALLHDVVGLALPLATPIAFLASFAITYTMQRTIAFNSGARVVASVGRYTALVAFNTVATTGIVWGIAALGWPWIVGKVLAVVATTIWNYFAYRYWVFASPKESSTHV